MAAALSDSRFHCEIAYGVAYLWLPQGVPSFGLVTGAMPL